MHQLQMARDTACQMELATYKGEHIVQAAGLVKDVEIPAKWARTDATLPRFNKWEVFSYCLVVVGSSKIYFMRTDTLNVKSDFLKSFSREPRRSRGH